MNESFDFSKEQIIRSKVEFKEEAPGIYFLINGDEIVYVGQSIRPIGRISIHYVEGKKHFDGYVIIDVPKLKLDAVEAEYIWRLVPRYNGSLPHNDRYKSWREIKRIYQEYNLSKHTINRIIRENGIEVKIYGYNFYKLEPFIVKWIRENIQGDYNV